MHKVTFEVYIENEWIEFTVETDSPDSLIQNLIKIPNTHNITQHN